MLKKVRGKQYSAESIADTDFANVQVFLANTPTQAESVLQLKATRSISLHVNARHHLLTERHTSKIRRQVQISRQQYLIY